MTANVSEEFIVPAIDQSLDEDSNTQCESIEHVDNVKVDIHLKGVNEKEEEKLIEEFHRETMFEQECYSSDNVTEYLSDPPTLPSQQMEGSSSTSGSTISEGESSSEYGDTPEINDESRPPANEIVTGIAYNNMFYQREEVNNIGVTTTHPQQPTGSFGDDSFILPSSGWPPNFPNGNTIELNHEVALDTSSSVLPQELYSEPGFSTEDMNNGRYQSIAEIESLTVPENIQQVVDRNQGSLVIGRRRSDSIVSLNDLQDLISDPNDFLGKGTDAVARALNPLVSYVHNNPQFEVKYRTKVKVSQEKSGHRQTTTTERVPVSDPSNSSSCPEAFDGRLLIKHLNHYHHVYADILDVPSLRFKGLLRRIMGRIPKRRNPSATWDTVIDTICCMVKLVETIVQGLKNIDRIGLAERIDCDLHQLIDITDMACRARVMKCYPTGSCSEM